MLLSLSSDGYNLITIECPQSLTSAITNSIFTSIIKFSDQKGSIHYQITVSSNKYILYRNGILTHRNRKLENILYALEWQIVDDLIKSHRKYTILHAAALRYMDKGYIFIGRQGHGKTSISILLLLNDFELLSDEIALIEPSSNKIYPFPRNLIIKPHLEELAKQIRKGRQEFELSLPNIGTFYNPQMFGKVSNQPVTIHKIFFLTPNTEYNYKIIPLPKHQSAIKILENSFFVNKVGNKILTTLQKILISNNSYFLEIHNPLNLPMEAKKKLIEEILA